jgi:hypothetical protein
MQITRSSAEGTAATTKASAEWFTGDVYIDRLPRRACWRTCHFMPGARTAAPTETNPRVADG